MEISLAGRRSRRPFLELDRGPRLFSLSPKRGEGRGEGETVRNKFTRTTKLSWRTRRTERNRERQALRRRRVLDRDRLKLKPGLRTACEWNGLRIRA